MEKEIIIGENAVSQQPTQLSVMNDSKPPKKILKISNIKESLAILTFIGSTASVLMLFGFTHGAQFPIFEYASLVDFIIISINYFLPFIIMVAGIMLIVPFTKQFSLMEVNKKKWGISDFLWMLLAVFYISQIITPLFPGIGEQVIFVMIKNFNERTFRVIILLILGFIFQWKGFTKVVAQLHMKEYIHITILFCMSFLPLYCSGLIYIGYCVGENTKMALNYNDVWEVTTKDDRCIKAEVIFNLDKYAIIKTDSNGLTAIKNDNIKSLTRIKRK